MARKRFNAGERAVIAAALAGDGRIEVQNVTQWHAATLASGAGIARDSSGWESVACTIDSTRGTVRAGDPWPASPAHVRAVRA